MAASEGRDEGAMARLRAASPLVLVEAVLARRWLIKTVCLWLAERGGAADAEAAARLALAHARREAEPWVIAQLLSQVPHPAGLVTAVELLAARECYADLSAAEAVAAMGDRAVVPTLEAMIFARADVDARRGAARALGGLLGPAAVPTLRRAFREGRILARTAGEALARAEVSDPVLAAWLQGDPVDRALALEALDHRLSRIALRRNGMDPGVELAPFVRDALDDAGGELLTSQRERIAAWLDGVAARG